jgi:hypothetical protein
VYEKGGDRPAICRLTAAASGGSFVSIVPEVLGGILQPRLEHRRRQVNVTESRRLYPVVAALVGLVTLWAGCSLVPQKEPVPEELGIFFTASTGGEIEPCG